ncbi:hypothetical protein CPC735_052280 [Coccidioides posadasii C735 delta SOWgp]|uniref:AD domain-containing protein n=1 Tax=Coccidioides posadasii (strain C735) TaxID=222929 RepID=C5PH55_COCP7|nr:hypothetical protein CPC735_052280 [Coccidioides posadasii C735 delta SOWgp]EER23858.1 hypothetical protein CPC735_052280 [Coccidioides posadasii C735 delta SOWgp]|eukprot:XP_003066003.1 hypothetical protein CPC735_052280 [Coccidioides posadasii C735 delta SOWgp]
MAAENKRHASGAKGPGGAMTPNPGPSGTVSLEVALSGAIGARIRVTTAAPTSATLEGTLFTACPITNLIAINTSPLPPTPIAAGTPALAQPGDFHIIPVARIQSFQLLSLPSQSPAASPNLDGSAPFTDAYPTIYPLDIKSLRNREAAAVAKLQEREQRRGKGVTKEAQDLFDAFSRTMPARWDDTSIVVADAVIISKPYRVEDCRSLMTENGGVSAALIRVRKVLEMERKKIELRNAFPDSPQTADPNANANRPSGTAANTRDRDLRAAAVAVPRSNVRSSPAPAGSQRKGG